MENRNFFRALFWALLVFLLWSMIAQRIWPARPPAGPGSSPAGAPGEVTPSETTTAGGTGSENAAAGEGVRKLAARGGAPAQTLQLGDVSAAEESPFRMQVWLSSVGASVETLRLSDHQQIAADPERYRLLSPVEHGGERWRSFAMERVLVDGVRVDMKDVAWRAEQVALDDGQAVVFQTEIVNGDEAVLALEQRYVLLRQPAETGRHDIELYTTVRNLSQDAHDVQLVTLGPFGVTSEGRFIQDQKVFAAVREDGVIALQAETFADVAKKNGLDLYPRTVNEVSPLAWYGTGNVYFTATICPVAREGVADAVPIKNLRGFDLDGKKDSHDDVSVRAVTDTLRLATGAERKLHTLIYAGPKDRDVFEDARNADYLSLDFMQQIKQGYGSCTFNFLTDLMIGLLNWLERVFHNFGVAIICLVLIVRVLLHPITKKTQVNMVRVQQRMAKLHPKIEEIKRRCGNDTMKVNQETMKLYREEGVNPMSQGLSCLPMFLQMPIWVALYSSLSNNVAMRCHGFVSWINDLTVPDALYTFSSPLTVPIFGWKIEAFHLLPLLVGFTMFAQQKLMPKPTHQAAADSPQAQQAEQMQKIMPYMSLVMILIFYNFPSGLNLYIMTSSLIGAAEQLYIRKHISQQDLEGPPAAARAAQPKRSGPSLLEWIQKRAEEAQKLPSQRDQGKRRR